MKVFVCKDFGGSCNWRGRAETNDELLKKIARHGAIKHNMRGMSEEMRTKIMRVIKEK
jgi:predicted small metal-binding protein